MIHILTKFSSVHLQMKILVALITFFFTFIGGGLLGKFEIRQSRKILHVYALISGLLLGSGASLLAASVGEIIYTYDMCNIDIIISYKCLLTLLE